MTGIIFTYRVGAVKVTCDVNERDVGNESEGIEL